jgi:hypothetical protein
MSKIKRTNVLVSYHSNELGPQKGRHRLMCNHTNGWQAEGFKNTNQNE